jgi:hypothetical protein
MIFGAKRKIDDFSNGPPSMSVRELGKENVCLAEECGVDDCEGQLEENSKATIDVNDHE